VVGSPIENRLKVAYESRYVSKVKIFFLKKKVFKKKWNKITFILRFSAFILCLFKKERNFAAFFRKHD
jgi:hypothetical protein